MIQASRSTLSTVPIRSHAARPGAIAATAGRPGEGGRVWASSSHPVAMIDIVDEISCTCPAQSDQREVGRIHRFDVAPQAGGGWDAWGVALRRLLSRLVDGPTQCVIVSQGAPGRYVQWMIGHRRAHLEVSSNHYLAAPYRLSTTEERHLRTLGFDDPHRTDRPVVLDAPDAPDEHDDPETAADGADSRWPRNWLLDLDLTEPRQLSRLSTLVSHLVEEVALFDPRRTVTIEQFLADHPCEHCSWGSVRGTDTSDTVGP